MDGKDTELSSIEEDSSDLVLNLFRGGEYAKLLKHCDSEEGIVGLLDEPTKAESYVYSCYRTNRPRKFSSSLKKVYDAEIGKSFIQPLLIEALEDDRRGIVRTIRKIVSEDEDMYIIVESEILDWILRDKFRPNGFSTSMMAEMISRTLNNDDFYQIKQSEDTLESLRLRVQKLFRSRNFERVISWLGGTRPRDENFQSYKFLLLSYRSIGEQERGVLLIKEATKKIKDPENFDSILDFLYTIGDNEGLIEAVEVFGKEKASFKSNFIIARTLRRMGDIGGSERIIEDSKRTLLRKIEQGDIGASESISNIKEIGFSGDIDSSENLLHVLISKKGVAKEIIDDGRGFEIIDLFRDTLDRQKRIRLRDSLGLARILIGSKRFEEALRVLKPYVIHGIRNSAELFELYIISANGSSEKGLVMELIEDCSDSMEPATVDRIAHVLEVNGMLREHRRFCELIPDNSIDSFKFLRSYFNVVERDSRAVSPKEILIRISKKKNPDADSVVYFIERYSRFADPSDIEPLVKTLRIDKLTRIYCSMRIGRFSKDPAYLVEIFAELLELGEEEVKKKNFRRAIEEFINISHSNNEDGNVIKIIKHFGLAESFDRKLTSAKIRSLIAIGDYQLVEGLLKKHRNDFSEIERWRFLIEIGSLEIAQLEMEEFQGTERKLEVSELRSLKSIYFKLGMFRDYLDITSSEIMEGNFTLSDLTRHYYSLFKIGDDAGCIDHHRFLRSHFCHFAEKRAVIAIVGYDFGLSDDFLLELETATMMEPNSFRIPLMISKSFLGMERPDVSFYFLKKALRIDQRDRGVIEIGRRIQEMMIDLGLDPSSINYVQINEEPIFTDVEVLRRLMEEVNNEDPPPRGKRKKVVAVHSHTLDIGGAERQASLLLELLDRGSVKNSGFSLVTHRVPNKSNIGQTYYRKLPIQRLTIKEYIKPVSEGKISDAVDRIVGHLSSVKARRLRNLVRIFSSEEYDVAHTWQDYCNIYGGIAALIAGVPRVVMSARTMPPPQKGRLASRQGRSYRECYRILLGSDRTMLTHNSDFGNGEYVKWLGVSEEKNLTVHNGLDVSLWKKKTKKEFDLRKSIGIEKDAIIVGYVGRFTSDKRPWLFLKVAEEILRDGSDIPISEELAEWYEDNEDFKTETRSILNPRWKGNGLVNFVMLGDGPQFNKAKGIIEKSEILRGRVHLVGFSDRVGEYLRNFDCFLLTSKIEGLPNVIIEAQACGVPVLSTNAGGSRECIIEGETGIIAYDDSLDEMCKHLNEIISNETFSKKAKKLGANFVEKKFGIKTYSKGINELYRSR